MSFIVIIPARRASSRLPGKVLADIGGRPMLAHVWERAGQAGAEQVHIATDDDEIEAVACGFGARVVMTAANHASGSDRVAEAARKLGLDAARWVVNLQADEPGMPAACIAQLGRCRGRDHDRVYTLAGPLDRPGQLHDPAVVKVVTDAADRALYFSRAPIPWLRDNDGSTAVAPAMRHIGIYAYSAGLLQRWRELPPGTLEQCERLEQLRLLENGIGVNVETAAEPVPAGVDTPADLARVRRDGQQ